MASLHQEALGTQRLGQPLLDLGGLAARELLQVHDRPREQLEPALEHAAGRADSRLVLVEPLGDSTRAPRRSLRLSP